MMVGRLKVCDSIVQSFVIAKNFQASGHNNSMDFSPKGRNLICGNDDDSIVIYDCANEGIVKDTLFSKKYGVSNICYTHEDDKVLYSSNKINDDIRYQSLHDNRYIQYFNGHTKRVVSTCLSPVDDSFISGSLDNTVRLWDLKSSASKGVVQADGNPIVSYDPEGMIFAIGTNSEIIRLFDERKYEKGPFATFKLPADQDCTWTHLKFSVDAKKILISSNGSITRLIDAFNGKPLHSFKSPVDAEAEPLSMEASFSPDGQYVLVGTHEGNIQVWNTESGSSIGVLQSKYLGLNPSPLQCVKFNPRFMMIASGGKSVSLWLPTAEE